MGLSQVPWGFEALTSIKYTNKSTGWVWEGKKGTQRLQWESEKDSGPSKLCEGDSPTGYISLELLLT